MKVGRVGWGGGWWWVAVGNIIHIYGERFLLLGGSILERE